MLTLREAQLTLKTMNLLAILGMLPFGINVARGKLERLSRRRLLFWGFCAVVTALQIIHSISQAVILYTLSDRIGVPIYVAAMHMLYIYCACMFLPYSVLTSMSKYDLIIKVFNELFKGEVLTSATRPWRHSTLPDLMLRMLFPAVAFYILVGWTTVLSFEPTLPSKLHNSSLLISLEGSTLCRILLTMVDEYAALFFIANHYFFVLLVDLCCEKVRVEGRGARNMLRCKRPNHRIVRRAMKSARIIQLYISMANDMGRWPVFTQKFAYLGAAVGCGYIVIRLFSQNVILGFFATFTGLICIATWYTTCYFTNIVPEETWELHEDIVRPTLPFFRADVLKYMRSVRSVYVQDGKFRGIQRESFLLYVDFLVNQLVAVLLINPKN